MIKGVDHFLGIFRIVGKPFSEQTSHGIHVQVVVLHQVQFAEDAFAKTSASDGSVRRDIHQCLLVLIGQREIGLPGTSFD